MHRADQERAALGRKQGEQVGQTVGPVDQCDVTALAHRFREEAGPGFQSVFGNIGPAAGGMRAADGAGVVEERRVREHGVEGAQLEGGEALGDIAGDRLDPFLQSVQRRAAPRQLERGWIALEAPEACFGTADCRLQQHRAWATADVEHPGARTRVAGRGEQGGVRTRPIAGPGLQQPHPPSEQPILACLVHVPCSA